MNRHWKDLKAWKQSHDLVLSIYELVRAFPNEEKFSLTDQIKRAAYSVPSNIVEGHSRSSNKEFIKYLYISRASLEELRYFVLLSKDLKYISLDAYNKIENSCLEISKILNGLIRSLK
jgi:four helix bundle protein